MQAIILKSKEVSEYDRRLIVFSKEKGKLHLWAKGIRKPRAKLAGHLELFNLVDLEVAGKTIIGARVIDRFQGSDLNKLENVFFIADLIDEFVLENFADKKLFDLLVLNSKKNINFEAKFLKIMGFAGAKPKNIKQFLRAQT